MLYSSDTLSRLYLDPVSDLVRQPDLSLLATSLVLALSPLRMHLVGTSWSSPSLLLVTRNKLQWNFPPSLHTRQWSAGSYLLLPAGTVDSEESAVYSGKRILLSKRFTDEMDILAHCSAWSLPFLSQPDLPHVKIISDI